MSDPIGQKIVDEIKRRLAEITTANGYASDLGSGPIEEFAPNYQEAELPALGVFDLTDFMTQDFAQEKGIMHRLAMEVRIFGLRETTLATMRLMGADVQRAIITNPDTQERDPRLAGLAVDMQPEEAGPVRNPDNYQVDGYRVAFAVQFLTAPFNAYGY
jgi:hypothetical protein